MEEIYKLALTDNPVDLEVDKNLKVSSSIQRPKYDINNIDEYPVNVVGNYDLDDIYYSGKNFNLIQWDGDILTDFSITLSNYNLYHINYVSKERNENGYHDIIYNAQEKSGKEVIDYPKICLPCFMKYKNNSSSSMTIPDTVLLGDTDLKDHICSIFMNNPDSVSGFDIVQIQNSNYIQKDFDDPNFWKLYFIELKKEDLEFFKIFVNKYK